MSITSCLTSCRLSVARPPAEEAGSDPEGAPLVEEGEAKLPPTAGQKLVRLCPFALVLITHSNFVAGGFRPRFKVVIHLFPFAALLCWVLISHT